jgi:hypothetical protein
MAKTVRGAFHPELIRGDKRQGDNDVILMFGGGSATPGHSLTFDGNGNAIDSGAAGGATLENNGTANGSQTLLNLKNGAGIAITDDGVGGITIAGSTPVCDVVFAYPGAPPNAVTFSLVIFARTVNFAANFAGSQGYCGAAPSASATYTFYKNGVACATAVINTSGTFTFSTTGGAPVSFAAGDKLTVLTPATDLTLSSVTMTLAGTR